MHGSSSSVYPCIHVRFGFTTTWDIPLAERNYTACVWPTDRKGNIYIFELWTQYNKSWLSILREKWLRNFQETNTMNQYPSSARYAPCVPVPQLDIPQCISPQPTSVAPEAPVYLVLSNTWVCAVVLSYIQLEVGEPHKPQLWCIFDILNLKVVFHSVVTGPPFWHYLSKSICFLFQAQRRRQ